MTLFDGYVAVDWSAKDEPAKGENSIWIAVCNSHGTPMLKNPATRQDAMERIGDLLDTATAEGRRLLCGFDSAFGYPEGTAQMLTGCDSWATVWARIAEVIEDGPNNMNNRFEVAAELNAHFEGEGPFWGMHHKQQIEGLRHTRPEQGWEQNLPPALRYAEELVPNAQEVWKLFYPGNVGGQALTGIAALEGLRHNRRDVRIWPFETLGEGRAHVLAEIYPSLINPLPPLPDCVPRVNDARQVYTVALTLRELDQVEALQQHLRAPNQMPDRVRREEGAILGMQDQVGFNAAAGRAVG